MSVNIVLLVHSHTLLFAYSLADLMLQQSRVVVRDCIALELKIFTLWPCVGTVCQPFRRIFFSLSPEILADNWADVY